METMMTIAVRRVTRSRIPVLATVAGAMALAACSGTVFDYKRKSPPDEFSVVKRAPLVMPPDYGLRPPQPGQARPQELEPTEQAKALLFQRRVTTSNMSQGEASLLQAAGAASADPTIRSTVNRETAALTDANSTVLNRVMFWRPAADGGTLLDPSAEAKRIAEARATGQPVSEGEIPTIRRTGTKALFGNLF